jgi:hypothetical protein
MGLGVDDDERIEEITRQVKDAIANPPEATSMHSGDNVYNNDIDWNKASQAFSPQWIDWDARRGPIAFDSEPYQLEFALNSSRKLVVQKELTGKGHIDLSNGDNCFCAGTFHFNGDGYLTAIHLDSGHYRPSVEHGRYLIATLIHNFYDLDSPSGKRNLTHFLDNVIVHVYNNQTRLFDACTANDIMTGRYAARLRQREIEEQQRLEKLDRINVLKSLVDNLLQFNTSEFERLKKQSPVTGKDGHKAKVAAFQANLAALEAISEIFHGRNIDEDVLKERIKAVITDTKKAADMHTHTNIDAIVGFFKGGEVQSDSQKNYANFVKANQKLINKLYEPVANNELRF